MSNDTRLFKFAGKSTFRGTNTYRFANGANIRSRVLVLERNGHVDIELYELPQPMTKTQAIAYLTTNESITAVLPKTGRGSGATAEHVAAQTEHVKNKEIAIAKKLDEVAADDDDFFNNLGTK